MQVIATRKRLMIVTRYPECAAATIHDHFLLEYAQEQGGLSEDFARRLVPQLLAFARSAAAHPTISARDDYSAAQELVKSYHEMYTMMLRSKLLVAEGADGPDPAGAVLKIGLLDDIPMRPKWAMTCSFRYPGMWPLSHRKPLMDLLYYSDRQCCISPPELHDMKPSPAGDDFWLISPVRSRVVAPPAA